MAGRVKSRDPFELKSQPGFKAPDGWGPKRYGIRPRNTWALDSDWWTRTYPRGTSAEYQIYLALVKEGLKPGVDFLVHPAGVAVDFLLPGRNLGIVLAKNAGGRNHSIPLTSRADMAKLGYDLVTIDADEALRDARAAVRQALR